MACLCCARKLYSADLEAKLINDRIEKQLKMDKRHLKNQIRILLLGTGESGKSTLIKQMRIIHGVGYSIAERSEFIDLILENIKSSMFTLLDAMNLLAISFAESANVINAEIFLNYFKQGELKLDSFTVQAIKELWCDKGVQKCYARRREFQLIDSAKYFLTEIDRIGSENYIPSEQDLLRSRLMTNTITEYPFKLDKYEFRMIDVGGQRSERRKWIHCFENVTSILFIASLAEYDLNLAEADTIVNRMDESLALFTLLLDYNWFADTSFILFLNKRDLFEEKVLSDTHLDDYFPEFTGPKRNVAAAAAFIQNKYEETAKEFDRNVFCHCTTATNTDNIKIVFCEVKNAILTKQLGEYQLL